MITSSVDEAHTPLEMGHLKVALDPAASPVTVVVGEDGVVMVAVPVTSDQVPVPTAGELADMVNVDVLQSV